MTCSAIEETFVAQLALIEGNATPQAANVVPDFAGSLPSGYDIKGSHSKVNAGQLVDLITTAMQGRPNWIAWNLMSQEVEINGRPLSPTEQGNIYIPLQQRGWSVSKGEAMDALAMAAQTNVIHPVQSYLESLRGTRAADISRLASTYLRPADLEGDQTIYDRMLQKTLVGAVARAYLPGCQHDTCCVLKGGQGIKKTTFWRTLFGEHFAIHRGSIGDKDTLLVVHANWGLELGELDSITSQTHAGHLKNFLTTAVDHFRPPYGVKVAPCPRPSIFVGSCNAGSFLHDDTGERRWWIIPCELPDDQQIDTDALALVRDEIWAGALALYKQKHPTFLDRADELANADLNLEYSADNPLEIPIDKYLRKNSTAEHIYPDDLLAAMKDCAPGASINQQQRWIHAAMTQRKWVKHRVKLDGSRPRLWQKL